MSREAASSPLSRSCLCFLTARISWEKDRNGVHHWQSQEKVLEGELSLFLFLPSPPPSPPPDCSERKEAYEALGLGS